MADSLMGRCGIDCGACEYRTQMNCPGCYGFKATRFWGECAIAKCCTGKGLEHCGGCGEFPCDTLNSFAYDPQQGDNGKRIANCREWNEIGYDAWRRAKDE